MSPDRLDKLNIVSSCNLSCDDISSLSLLYKPLIGDNAVSLYLVMANLLSRNNLKSEQMFHSDLYDLTMTSEETFYNARLKLEGIGLLSSYKDSEEYYYLIKEPLTPKQFLVDGILGSYLYSAVGQKMFNFLVDHFKIYGIEKQNLENITVCFDDVFKSEPTDVILDKGNNYLVGRKHGSGAKLNEYVFDYELFLSQIDISFIGMQKSLFKKLITNIAYVFEFDENDAVSLFIQSISSNQKFDESIFKERAKILYQFKNPQKQPTLKEKNVVSGEDEQLAQMLDTQSLKGLLDKVIGVYPTSYLTSLSDIYNEIALPRGVINSMILGVSRSKNGQLPNIAYFKKVAQTYIDKGIVTTKKAVAYLKVVPSSSKQDTTKRTRKYNTKKKNDEPDWLQHFIENIDSGVEKL